MRPCITSKVEDVQIRLKLDDLSITVPKDSGGDFLLKPSVHSLAQHKPCTFSKIITSPT